MANVNSTTVANLEATPSVVSSSSFMYGKVRVLQEVFETSGSESADDTVTLFPVALDANILSAYIANDNFTTGTYDLGFHLITDNAIGAAIDADVIADGQVVTSAKTWTDVTHVGTSAADLANTKQKLWELLGYSSITTAREAAGRNEVYCVLTWKTAPTEALTVAVRLMIGVE